MMWAGSEDRLHSCPNCFDYEVTIAFSAERVSTFHSPHFRSVIVTVTSRAGELASHLNA
jgi:hypothetical protein